VETSIELLREQGERITTPRRLVLEELASAATHLSAEDLLARVKARSAGVHLATVYRVLEALMQYGIVDHVHLPHGATTYHVVEPGHRNHLHLVCRGCDTVLDAPPDTLDEVAARLDQQYQFRLAPHHVALTGWCSACVDDRVV